MFSDIWLNLPVSDLQRACDFYTAMGFTRHLGPGNSERSASFSIGEKSVILMLFTRPAFEGFVEAPISDTESGAEVLFSLGVASREQIDDIAKRVPEAGGKLFAAPRESQGWMYGCGFCDPDGHRYNALFMDPSKLPPG